MISQEQASRSQAATPAIRARVHCCIISRKGTMHDHTVGGAEYL